jgi:hypothetical protein
LIDLLGSAALEDQAASRRRARDRSSALRSVHTVPFQRRATPALDAARNVTNDAARDFIRAFAGPTPAKFISKNRALRRLVDIFQ